MTCMKYIGIITKIWALVISGSMAYGIVRFSVGWHAPLPMGGFVATLMVFAILQAGLFFSEEAMRAKRKVAIFVFVAMLPAIVFFSVMTVEGLLMLYYMGRFRDVYYFSAVSALIYFVQAIRLAKTMGENRFKPQTSG